MRKNQKDKCLDLLKTMEQGQEEVGRLLDKGNVEQAKGMLGDLQSAAESVGGSIEQSEGEGTKTVGLLEKYCEVVYQIYASLDDSISGVKAVKKLRQALIPVENSLNNDIPMRREVVFLPYKASMWDSLETVWRRAAADPLTDAYVIPIPYFDRNPDGSLGTEYYEGDLYPKDVPVTDYRTFDFAAHHPDQIYIHNPYDDGNYVTTVHPFFYSANLKQFTDDLVYIPYFILSDPDPSNADSVRSMAHFATVSGVYNADHVIVQSEAMRQAYIQALVWKSPDGEKTRAYWEKKISGAGSPKVEKLLLMKREELEIPEEWKELIRKPIGSNGHETLGTDGNGKSDDAAGFHEKKIVLYNTSLGAFLGNSEWMIGKIREVLETFKRYQNSVTLLWRPHPLLPSTIKSMRPQFYDQYMDLVAWYRADGFGIYDDTPELDRALVLCDQYYGDWSSLVWLAQKIGKPIAIQSKDDHLDELLQKVAGESDDA